MEEERKMNGYKKLHDDPKFKSSFTPPIKGISIHRMRLFQMKNQLLIIDINKKLLDDLSNYFAENYKVITTSSGFDALNIAVENNPALIITGTSIPGFDDFEICRQIKTNLKSSHIPLILLIPENIIGQKIRGYEVGADNIIANPVNIKLLAAQAKRLIQNRILIKEKFQRQSYPVEVGDDNASKDERFINGVKKIMKENLKDPDLNVKKLSEIMNTSTMQLYRNLRETTGYTPVEFIRLLRLQNAYILLDQKDITVSEACYQSGFNNVSYFIKCFKTRFGQTPASFMNKGIKKEIYPVL